MADHRLPPEQAPPGWRSTGQVYYAVNTPVGFLARGETFGWRCRHFACSWSGPADIPALIEAGCGDEHLVTLAWRQRCPVNPRHQEVAVLWPEERLTAPEHPGPPPIKER